MTKFSPPSSTRETAGFVAGLVRQARLAWGLLRDSRVPGWTKLIPVAGLLYLIFPIDLVPDTFLGVGQLDDVGIILLSLKMFVEMSPPAVVREHLERLVGKRGRAGAGAGRPSDSDEVIDVPYRIVGAEETGGEDLQFRQ